MRTAKTAVKADASFSVKESLLPAEQQRKYDYFFLEAMRMKEKNEYDAAFGLLQHCLDINPNASSALYEISQYYMFLRQVPQGQEALEKAVASAPDNYWYSQGLASLYQQQNELDKAITLLEQMAVRFPGKQDPLFNLLDLYGRQEKYDEVISTLNRLEKHMGKNEQLSMEKFRIYLQMKDDKKAFQEIESLVQEYPMDMRYQVILGDVYLQNGKKQEAYDVYQNPDLDFVKYYPLSEVLRESDLISLHCPLTESSYHLINTETISLMKENVVFVNTSRGALVNTEDLIKGIRSRKFHGVGLDVYEEETENVFENRQEDILESSVTARLLSFPNVIVTSHQGFFTEEALAAISRTTLENACAFERGRIIKENQVK